MPTPLKCRSTGNNSSRGPGVFDYAVVDALVNQSRKNDVRLVLLWFATWKNGSPHYVPLWIKQDPKIYARARMIGANGRPVDSASPFSRELLEADKRAFVALMRHLKTIDPQHTVIMVQVENEAGTWGAIRDYGPAAQKAFESPVPAEVLAAMNKKPRSPTAGWKEVFGNDADEYFHAWAVARYIGEVAAAGKAEYPLPLYANAALRDPISPGPAGSYESGGPTDNVLPLWKAAAPAIDILAPDIYMDDYAKVQKILELYRRPDNPLFVPEVSNAAEYARFFFLALGHQAIGFAPFGIDYTGSVNFPLGAKKIERGNAGAVRHELPAGRPDDARAGSAEPGRQGPRRRREEGDAGADPGGRRVEGRRAVRRSPVRLRQQSTGEPRADRPRADRPAGRQSISRRGISLPRRFPDQRTQRNSDGQAARVPAGRRGSLRERQVQGRCASGTATRPTGGSTSRQRRRSFASAWGRTSCEPDPSP